MVASVSRIAAPGMLKAQLGKTIAVSLSAYLLFGPKAALITALFNLIISAMARPSSLEKPWFSGSRIFEKLKDGFSHFLALALFWNFLLAPNIQWAAGRFFNLAENGFLPGSAYTFNDESELVIFFLKQLFVYPLAKEIFHRGFLQEKIEKLQSFFSPGNENRLLPKYLRIAMSASFFTLCYFSTGSLLANFYNFTFGAFSASLKEESDNLIAIGAFGVLQGLFDSATMFWNILEEI